MMRVQFLRVLFNAMLCFAARMKPSIPTVPNAITAQIGIGTPGHSGCRRCAPHSIASEAARFIRSHEPKDVADLGRPHHRAARTGLHICSAAAVEAIAGPGVR
jgi:hypothetical protein